MMKIAVLLFCCLVWTAAARADAVRLQIVGPDKKPVAGAQVRVLESSAFWEERSTEAPLELVSDAEGKIAFETKNPLIAPKFEAGMAPVAGNTIYARIIAPQMAVASQALKVGDNEITLQAGQDWGGAVLDEDQKPVAGVKIVLNGFGIPGEASSVYFPRALRFETTTGEDGKWSFSNVPRERRAVIQVIDPRFVREALNLSLVTAAPPLFLERGATIKGRLLAPDGTPAADVPLFPGGNGGYATDDFRTAPDGTFVLSGLAPGDFYLQSLNYGRREKSLPFLIEPKNVKSLKIGETRDIGDWKAETGVLVKGKVVESGANTPVAEAYVSLWGRGNGQGTSDKNGEFSFRASDDASQG
ncbi:MAG: carboxypeptidase-like regulatory domain-containing protein, partial [Armatimonadetes bacterium]|nr:carboxypeptidase-like regulatory domain-containing protein [Armatimonadota bacterium]